MFWILVILSYAAAEKLDRTYLPPPGAKFSGGSPGVIGVPLEYPKTEYSRYDFTTKPEIAIGIDRVGPKQIVNSYENINYNNTPLPYTDKSYPFSSTTYSQTTPPPYNNRNIVSSVFPTNNTYSLQNSDFKYENANQNTNNYSTTEFVDEKNYRQQFQYGNKLPGMPGFIISQDDASISSPLNIDFQSSGDVDSIIANSIACNNSAETNTLINPCRTFKYDYQNFPKSTSSIYHEITDVTSPSFISKNNNLPSVINNYYSTTPTLLHSSIFEPTTMRPERIPAQADREAVILNYENIITPEGYVHTFDTSNGIHGDEAGITLNNVRAKGSYSYFGDDGKLYTVVYTADENGFQPRGDHLPTAPPIPDAILKVIEKAYQDKEIGVIDDGSYDEKKYGYKKYEKVPHDYKKLIEPVLSNEDLDSKKDLGMNTNHTREFLEILMNPNGNAYSTRGQEFDEENPPETNYYEVKEMPQLKLDKEDLGTRDDVLNYEQQNLPATVTASPTSSSGFYEQRKIHSTTPSNEDTKLKYTERGYQYYRPSTTNLNEFPSRFTEIKNLIKNGLQDQKTTPKPFLTPYVSRNDDQIQNYDNDDQMPQRLIYPDQKDNEEEGNNYYNDESMKNGFNNGNIYQKYEEPYMQFTNSKPTFVPVVSTVVQKQFPPRISTTLPRNHHNTGVTQASSRSSFPVPSIDLVTQNKTSFLPNSSLQPDFSNQYERTDLPDNCYTNQCTSEKISEITEEVSVSPIPNLKVSYSPNIDTTVYTDLSKPHSSSEEVVVENFSGPKSSQRFDPLTGYHY